MRGKTTKIELLNGDHVLQAPSVDEWAVQSIGIHSAGLYVEPMDSPSVRARASECELIESAADRRAKGLPILTEETAPLRMGGVHPTS